jgi:mycofactocin glycosyltransferase
MDVDLKLISVVVPTAHRPELLKDCLSSLLEQDFPKELYEVIVVDDGDGEAASVVDAISRGIDTRIFHIKCGKHDVNAARNLGIQSARSEVVCLVDDDTVAPSRWLRSLAEGIQRHPDVECFAGGVQPLFEGRPPRSCGCWLPGAHLDLGSEEHEAHAWGCNMAIRKAAFDLAGPFRQGMDIETDTEWQLRLRSHGGRVLWIPDAWLWHRRVQSDLRTPRLLSQHFRRGMLLVELGHVPTRAVVARIFVRSLLHAALRRCTNGLFRAARSAGMAIALIRGRRGKFQATR